MNIIRSRAIELDSIPAIAYKQKLSSGGSGLRILRLDQDSTAVFTIDKGTGNAIPYKKIDESLFPEEAVLEALDSIIGLPYSSRGKIVVAPFEVTISNEPQTIETESEIADQRSIVESDEYQSFVARYCDERGRLNYQLINKDLIQFASKSKRVSEMVGQHAHEEELLIGILQNRLQQLTGSKNALSDEDCRAFIETLEEIDTRGAFKELRSHLRRMLSRAK